MWKPGEMETLLRLVWRFFDIFLCAGRTGTLLAGIKDIEKAFAVIRKRLPKWLQMPGVMELVGHRARKCDAENPDVEDGGGQGAAAEPCPSPPLLIR